MRQPTVNNLYMLTKHYQGCMYITTTVMDKEGVSYLHFKIFLSFRRTKGPVFLSVQQVRE